MFTHLITRNNRLTADFEGPASVLNAIRRELVGNTPILEVQGEIKSNTTRLPHEYYIHKLRQLPVLLRPTDRWEDVSLSLDVKGPLDVFTTNFDTSHPIWGADPDSGEPLLFTQLAEGEQLVLTGKLGKTVGSLVSLATYIPKPDLVAGKPVLDEILSKTEPSLREDRRKVWERNEAFLYAVPDQWEWTLETDGTVKPRVLLKEIVEALALRVREWFLGATPQPEAPHAWRITTPNESHTLGNLLQGVLYDLLPPSDGEFVAYDVPHPLRPEMVLRIATQTDVNELLKKADERCTALFQKLIRSL